MIISTAQHSIDGVAVKIVATNEVQRTVWLRSTSSNDFYIGPTSAVTTATGFLVDKAASYFTCKADANDEIWAIASSGTHTVSVLQVTD